MNQNELTHLIGEQQILISNLTKENEKLRESETQVSKWWLDERTKKESVEKINTELTKDIDIQLDKMDRLAALFGNFDSMTNDEFMNQAIDIIKSDEHKKEVSSTANQLAANPAL